MPLTRVRAPSVPPLTLMSSTVKLLPTSSLKVKVSVAVSPALRLAASGVMATVGRTVSTARVTELLASSPSALALPAASANVPLATLTTPLAELPGVGVKTAV